MTTTASGSALQVTQAESRLDAAVRAVGTAERRIRGVAYDLETDSYNGRRVWDVDVVRGVTRPYQIDVRADGRVVVRQRREPTIPNDVRELPDARITLVQAMRVAAGRAGAGSFDGAQIDSSGVRIVWEVDFLRSGGRSVEVTVDARTGKVLEVDVD